MKAVAKTKREAGIEVIETRPDPISDDGVQLSMRSASICGSDLGFYKFTAAFQSFAKIPVIMGHEFAGEVKQIGKNVRGFAPGDRVVSESVIYCGSCRYCRSGMTNICKNFTVFGMQRNGGFSEEVSVYPNLLHRVPDAVSFQEAGIVEPLTVAINGTEQIPEIGVGKSAIVVGPGPIGLLSAEVLRLRGVTDITVMGLSVDRSRLELAAKLGFRAMDWEKENPRESLMSVTDGYGADIIVVTSASSQGLKSALPLVAKGGQVVLVGIIPEEVSLPVADLVRRQVAVLGSYGSRWEHYEQAIAVLAQHKVRAESIITHKFALDEADEAFEAAMSKVGCKVQFRA